MFFPASKRQIFKNFKAFIAALSLSALGALPVAAQSWPDKPVRVVVPAPAGSSLDVIVRSMGETLKARWGQPLVVENKPGAGGTIGMDAVAKAAPDGYTLGIGFNGPIAFGPFMFKKMPYDPAKDLLPIVLTTSQPNVMAVPTNHPANNLREFVAWAKSQGNKVSYASVGLGSSSHLTMELLKSTAGFEATHVPFNGSPPAALSVAQGETQALMTVEPALLALVQGGRLKLLAVTSPQRSALMPQVATFREQGVPDLEIYIWSSIQAPAGTPDAIIAQANREIVRALRSNEVREKWRAMDFETLPSTPEELTRFVQADLKRWGEAVRLSGFKASE